MFLGGGTSAMGAMTSSSEAERVTVFRSCARKEKAIAEPILENGHGRSRGSKRL